MAVADALLARNDEPGQRSAASRYYYAAYHRAAAWHEGLPIHGHALIGPGGGTHQQLVNALKNPDPSLAHAQRIKSLRLGSKLDVLRLRRQVADYDLNKSIGAGEFTMQRDQAKSFVNDCNQP